MQLATERLASLPRDRMLNVLRDLLRQVFVARYDGANYERLARAHGYADGFMRALLESGIVEQRDLLTIVNEERRKAFDQVAA
ncbi:MAG: hypothetical protein IT379_26845 [Deltaproteobacteria bacterium]|nr:hypothetical protein [Deltaproteobacteria bacterium]